MSNTPTPPAASLDDFVALSAILTGIAAAKLHPLLDTHGTAQTYFDVATERGGANFTALMSVYAANKGKPPDQIAAAVLAGSGPAVAATARSVMLMWYLASWFDPAQVKNPPAGGMQFTVVSADAYTQGWVWAVAQTHPMGYSEWSFGYWKQDPPPLAAFIGGSGS